MAAGAGPFRGENLYRLCTAIIQEPLPPGRANSPAGLAAVIKRCLQKEPARRYQRASELRAALEALEISATAVAAPPHAARTETWKLMWWAMLGVLIVLVVLLKWLSIGLAWRNGAALKSSGNTGISVPARVQLAVLPASGASGPQDGAFNDRPVETPTAPLTALTGKQPLAGNPGNPRRAPEGGPPGPA